MVAVVATAKPLTLSGTNEKAVLDQAIHYFDDDTHSLTIEQILNQNHDWRKNGNVTFNQGYSKASWWLKLDISNDFDGRRERLIELRYAVLDYVDVYISDGNRLLAHHAMGDKLSYQSRVIDHRFFIIPLEWQANQSLSIYFKVRSSSAIQMPILIWEEKAFFSFDSTRTLLLGLFFGTLLAIAAYNLLIFFALKEKAYFVYVGYVVCMGLFLASLDGYAFRYLWPNLWYWNDKAIVVFLSGVLIFGSEFTRIFLKVHYYNSLLNKGIVVAIIGGFVFAISAFLLPYAYNIVALICWAAATCILGLISGVYCWVNGQNTAKYYIIAWSSMLLGGLVLASSKLNILPSNLFTDYAAHIGTSLEIILLSFALAERINGERKLRYEAQKQVLLNTQKINDSLENRVSERTEELQALTERLRDLSNTDQLTGLNNRRQLEDAIQKEWERAKRFKHSLAVILLDIDHFKLVNDNYGHLVGDDCIKEVARRIEKGLRGPSDLVARYGGEEFCILSPENDVAGAVVMAERIRENIQKNNILLNSGDLLSVTISAGVYACIPQADMDLRILVKEADSALYQAKALGRNRVCYNDIDQHIKITNSH